MTADVARTISQPVAASADRVYAFAADPRNMPAWAPNLGTSIVPDGDDWVVQMAQGPVRLRMAAANSLGVLDHWVVAPDGQTFYNPMRVVAQGEGALISFTLFRQPGWTDAELDADAALVAADLVRLKALVEG